jgi:hypothetical protein
MEYPEKMFRKNYSITLNILFYRGLTPLKYFPLNIMAPGTGLIDIILTPSWKWQKSKIILNNYLGM